MPACLVLVEMFVVVRIAFTHACLVLVEMFVVVRIAFTHAGYQLVMIDLFIYIQLIDGQIFMA